MNPKRSPLALAVLALLVEAPMHPYRMQQLIKLRGKGDVINVEQRSTLYKTVDRLERDGLIAVKETERDRQQPDRNVYELTEVGTATAGRWMREILSTPRNEFPEFPAAISLLPILEPEDVVTQLKERRRLLVADIEATEALLASMSDLPRMFVLEGEYQLAIARAELTWVDALLDDLESGRISWDIESLRVMAHDLENQS
jgi:DNA-binding PadR family transcriptional regulator